MSIRTKLLLYFITLSSFICIVGLISYTQIKSLIQPLTPQSIPLSLQNLSNTIEYNLFLSQLRYKQLLAEYHLEKYIFTNDISYLQDYYLDNAMVFNLMRENKNLSTQWNKVVKLNSELLTFEEKLIALIQENKREQAIQLLLNRETSNWIETQLLRMDNAIELNSIDSNEISLATVKIATKNINTVLANTLHLTLILFFDALIISLIFSYLSAIAISKPIYVLKDNFERIRQDINTEIDPKLLHLEGELGELSRSFNSLIIKLRSSMVQRDELIKEIELRKESEDRLKRIAARFEESNKELDEFAYVASHDLRAPLRAIQKLTDWIKEDIYHYLTPKSLEYFNLLNMRVIRLDNLVTGILEYARAGKLSHHFESVDLNKLIQEIIENLGAPVHIKFVFDDYLPTFKTDRQNISRIFTNLIDNAIKHNDKQFGIINIGHRSVDKFYEFYIKDNGPGIDPAFQTKIFQLFQTTSTKADTQSTGIGLAIVKKILDKEGLNIWIQSELGSGTTFYFTWYKDPSNLSL